jgi:orotate phosphoribosyltransferase
VEKLTRHVGFETIEAVAGGETAGIPFAAWIAERLSLPMAYVRKQPKGFGRNARIEGDVPVGKRTLLVEDLTTDGGSKIQFATALREAGALCDQATLAGVRKFLEDPVAWSAAHGGVASEAEAAARKAGAG